MRFTSGSDRRTAKNLEKVSTDKTFRRQNGGQIRPNGVQNGRKMEEKNYEESNRDIFHF